MRIEEVPVNAIHPAAYNPRKDLKPGDPAYERLKKCIDAFGDVEPLVWNERSGNLVGGHQRFKILLASGLQVLKVSVVDLNDRDEKALNLALNKHSGEWDFVSLADLMAELDVGDFDMEVTGFAAAELEQLATWTPGGIAPDAPGSPAAPGDPKKLADRFLLTPFSVLNAREGWWQERKKAWIALGIESERGRGGSAGFGAAVPGEGGESAIYRQGPSFKYGAAPGGSMPPTSRGPDGKLTRRDLHAGLSPGGSPRPAMKLRNGKTVRGDGRGREIETPETTLGAIPPNERSILKRKGNYNRK